MDDEFENDDLECPGCVDPTNSASSHIRSQHRHHGQLGKSRRGLRSHDQFWGRASSDGRASQLTRRLSAR